MKAPCEFERQFAGAPTSVIAGLTRHPFPALAAIDLLLNS